MRMPVSFARGLIGRIRGSLSLLAAIVALSGRPYTSGLDQAAAASDLRQAAAGFHELFLHDPCTADYPPQPDTCLHTQLHEKAFTIGGSGVVHDVTLRIRGLFEPTTIEGGQTPYPDRPYFQVGGTIAAKEWSAWHIEVSNPKQAYWLNHYPRVGHVIYSEDFEATIPVAGGAAVVVRVVDGNDRQIDNGKPGRPDRMQIIKGVVDTPLAGQMLRLDVIRVVARSLQ
jgi:hypothetical protein